LFAPSIYGMAFPEELGGYGEDLQEQETKETYRFPLHPVKSRTSHLQNVSKELGCRTVVLDAFAAAKKELDGQTTCLLGQVQDG
jgi:hypothetical protein